MNKKVKLYGFGWLGKKMKSLFPDATVHDPFIGMISNEPAEVCFVGVPTPLKEDGTLDTSIVEDIVSRAKDDLIVIRSTLNPGTCDYLTEKYHKKIVANPEFLGETPSHPFLEAKSQPFMIIGGKSEDRKKLVNLYATVYNANVKIRLVTNYEAEVIKLSDNRAVAFKVIQAHELYLACEKAGLDYYTIRDAVYGDDPRQNLWFTFVYDQLGFNSSKCLVKDVPAWATWAKNVGADSSVTQKLVDKSNEYNQYAK